MLSSIRVRILVYSTAIVVACLAIMGAVTYFIVKSDNENTLRQNLKSITNGHALAIDEWIASKAGMVSAATNGVQVGDPQFVIKQLQKTGNFQVTTLGLPDKTAYTSSEAGLPPGFDPTARPWYKEVVQAGKPLVTKPYADIVTGKPMVSFAAPVMKNGRMEGVVSAAVFLDGVRDVVASVHPTPASLAFVVNRDGLMLAHSDEKLLRKPATEWSPDLKPETINALAAGAEPKTFELDGAAKLLQVQPIRGTDWNLVVALDIADATAGMRSVVRTSAIAVVLVALVAALAIGMLTATAFRRLSTVRDALDDISSGSGDLSRRLPDAGDDEVAQIAKSFNTFVEKMALTLREIRTSSEMVKVAAAEIAAGNLDLSSRTEQMASSLQETAASMEQLAGAVRSSADAANEAAKLSSEASRVAIEGGGAVANVVSTMNGIANASEKIADIIGVIDGIAFQTNILALNAAVEAARAGEQGRGFAVVASEVRSLAQRSATAAKEIKNLIDVSGEQVGAGAGLVQSAGETMTQVVANVERVNGVIAEISSATAEQSSGVEQINQAVAQIDQVTQQNAALVEQSAAAANSLRDHAYKLADVVGQFKLEAATA
ncbi:chemotaxis protein [Pandoraea terrae]|uniref:Chemotaxis protein n=1 Tax=Pandoraea terrae TaxID=1537710 RepID=A0A5E4VR79_9BURK|nr:methyl-accepting chemotaxis protein [Pandoraea terrae]VVE13550.1 chemotaxis protein [Pandoraea terrae]